MEIKDKIIKCPVARVFGEGLPPGQAGEEAYAAYAVQILKQILEERGLDFDEEYRKFVETKEQSN